MDKKWAFLLVLISTLGAGVFVYNQINIYQRVEKEIAEVDKQVMLLQSSNNEIATQLEYVGSLDFVEYIARTELKYVMPDEIVFVDEQSYND